MKSFRMLRTGNNTVLIVELSFNDIFKLLIGRELYLKEEVRLHEHMIIRQQTAYDAFNLTAPRAE